jgi:hypothetical protein
MRASLPLQIAGLLFAGAATTLAQSQSAHPAENGWHEHVPGLMILPLAGQPFTARIPEVVMKRMPDGQVEVRKLYTLVARDSLGRTYRESRHLVPWESDAEPPLWRFFINDPTRGTRVSCTPEVQTCWMTNYHAEPEVMFAAVGEAPDGKSFLVRESLGTQTIDGLEAEGNRETRTIAAGAVGNDKPIVQTKEFWYSRKLEINLRVMLSYPDKDETIDVTQLTLGEPAAGWFVIPAGWRMVDSRVPHGVGAAGFVGAAAGQILGK